MRKILVLSGLFLAQAVFGSVVFDNNSSTAGGSDASAAATFNIAPTTTNTYIVVGCSLSQPLTNVTVAGSQATFLVRATGNNISEIWGLFMPTSGTKAVQITGGASAYQCAAMDFTGVVAIGESATATGNAVTTLSTTFTNSGGSLVVDSIDNGTTTANLATAGGGLGHTRRVVNGSSRCHAFAQAGTVGTGSPSWTFTSDDASLAAVKLLGTASRTRRILVSLLDLSPGELLGAILK